MVDFLFARPADDRRGVVGQGDDQPLGRAAARRRRRAYETVAWDADALKASVEASASATSEARQGAGAGARRRHRPLVGPPLFESLELLGRERRCARLQAARERLGLTS